MIARPGTRLSIARWIGLSLLLFAVWSLATYFFKGRVHLLQQPTPLGRAVYVVMANILIGIFGAAWIIRSSQAHGVPRLEHLGFRSLRRTLIAMRRLLAHRASASEVVRDKLRVRMHPIR